MLKFSKYHALGNDYLVVEGDEWNDSLTGEAIRRICHRNFGLGSDGILVRLEPRGGEQFRVQIWNPDGSEAEKSGNGLRIFARYLWDQKCVTNEPFTVGTAGGVVTCQIADGGRSITVEMGEVSFDSRRIPVHGPPREVLRETMVVDGQSFEYSAATIGNPHCVLVRDHALADEARRLGPLIETQPRFPNRTNVQFVEILDRHRIAIEIWERGAGYTLASGSSSCAAAAVAVRLGFCDSPLSVHMPGGTLSIKIDNQHRALMAGPVCKVADGQMCREALEGTAGQAETDVFSLVPFDMRYAEIVQGWVRGRDEAAAWAGLSDETLSPATVAHWHADQDVFGFVLLRKELPVGYGEVWLNSDPDAVELARIIVAPASRGRGIGRILIDKLTAETPAADSKTIFLRVRPGNSRALRCYEKAAFRRVPSEEASIYNQGQPVEYVWLSRSITK